MDRVMNFYKVTIATPDGAQETVEVGTHWDPQAEDARDAVGNAVAAGFRARQVRSNVQPNAMPVAVELITL